jgi:hypothetical protein
MKNLIFSLICVLVFSGCASSKYSRDYNIRRNLMILENYELPRNKPTKFSKKKTKKQLQKNNKKYLRKLKRKI